MNGDLACGLSLLDHPELGVSNGAGFFLRNFGLALCSGRMLVLCAGVLSYVQGSRSYVQGSCLMCRDPSLMCRGQSLMCRDPSLMFRWQSSVVPFFYEVNAL